MNARRSGLTLIEVLAALSILAICAAAWAGLLAQGMRSARAAHVSEAEVLAASAQLARVAIWAPAELASNRGRTAGRFRIDVKPLMPSLFEVTISDSAGGPPLLTTAFYMRDTSALTNR